ncbi:DUF4214 domain-containing protein [Pseudoduganella rivuli]|nr:DUF4214 domain-containing protein [Pseudoduganella rivuli]
MSGKPAEAITVMPDGSLLVLRNAELSRFLPDGTLDTSFQQDGTKVLKFGAIPAMGSQDLDQVIMLGSGKLLLTGSAIGPDAAHFGNTSVLVARLNADGSIDTSFGGGKGVTLANLNPNATTTVAGSAMAIDGSITVVADTYVQLPDGTHAPNQIGLVRFLANGALDTSFGKKGLLLDAASGLQATDMAMQADGKIVVSATRVTEEGQSQFTLLRFNADGSRDTTFGKNGEAAASYPSQYNGQSAAASIALQPDGKIIVAGAGPVTLNGYTTSGMAVVRYKADGTLDTSFSDDGMYARYATPTPGKAQEWISTNATSVAITEDGAIIVSGRTWASSAGASRIDEEFVVIKLHADGTPDTTFGNAGVALSTLQPYGGGASAMALGADGSIILSGGAVPANGGLTLPTLVKFTPDGQAATNFGSDAGQANNSASWVQGYAPQAIAPLLTISDADLNTAARRYAGASITLERREGASADDQFVATGTLSFRNGAAYVGSANIGTVDNSRGALHIVFNSSATQALVNTALQSVAYQNSGTIQEGKTVDLLWTFSDGQQIPETAHAASTLTLHTNTTPYWIAALLNQSSSAVDLKAALETALGKAHGLNLVFDGSTPYTATEQAAIRDLIGGASAVANLPLTSGGAKLAIHAMGRIAPGNSGASLLDSDGADLWLGAIGNSAGKPAVGASALLHELGHALGLKDTQGGDAALPMRDERSGVSVMSPSGAATLGALDIAALQYLYGVNPATRSKDDTYQLTASASNFLWDGAGNDTISAAGLSDGITLHLQPGYWDYIGKQGSGITAPGQITINYGTAIENATGGNGADNITGTDGANVLNGGKGDDILAGLGGNDTLVGGDGTDTAVYQGMRASYTVKSTATGYVVTANSGNEGTDTLTSIERLQFSDGVVALNSLPTGQVTITGTPVRSQVLTANNTLADADGLGALSYQWLADGKAISGATGKTYQLTANEVGKAMTVMISYVDGSGTAESIASAPSKTVTVPATPTTPTVPSGSTGTVSINGKVMQNQTLTAALSLSGADMPDKIAYQWYADGVAVNGATGSAVLLTEATVGKRMTVTASYTNSQGSKDTITSSASAAVDNVNDAPAGMLSIIGSPGTSGTLGVSNGLTDADGLGQFSYRWFANGNSIDGATDVQLPLTAALKDKTITVTASYVDGHGTAESVTSAALLNAAPNQPGLLSVAWSGNALAAAITDADGVRNASLLWQASVDGMNWGGVAGSFTSDGVATVMTPLDALGKQIRITATYQDLAGHDKQMVALVAPNTGATLVGANARDTLLGGDGNDVLSGGGGGDVIDGGAGIDTARYASAIADYVITRNGAGNNAALRVADTKGQADTLSNVERLQFSDAALAFDVNGVAGQAYRLYQAAYNRAPDKVGLGYWISVMDKGAGLKDVAAAFTAAQEFQQLAGEHPTSSQAITGFYNNVLHRAPDTPGLNYWTDILESKVASLSDVLMFFSESPENVAALVGVTANGIAYTPYGG